MPKIFLNYRRVDASAWAHHLIFDPLAEAFGRENLFLDVDQRLPIGRDYRRFLDAEVARCDILIAIIGRSWLAELQARAAAHADGSQPDFVRVEIEQALARDIPVVPLLVEGASMPPIRELPEDLRDFVYRQSERAQTGPGLRDDTARFVAKLREVAPAGPARQQTAAQVATASPPQARDAMAPAAPQPWTPGEIFRDRLSSGAVGPEMVVIPAGRFLMGSPPDEPGRIYDEGPQREITFAQPFAMGRFAVTFDEYDAFCAATGAKRPHHEGWGRGRRPVINVSRNDATAFCDWLSQQTGARYRLPSEAEWEYACRAGTRTRFWWGDEISPDQANYARQLGKTVPVDAYTANLWGLFQTHGNVFEWCADAWAGDLSQIPENGSAKVAPGNSGVFRGGSWVFRGGSWFDAPDRLRSADRSRSLRFYRNGLIGFRLARTLVD